MRVLEIALAVLVLCLLLTAREAQRSAQEVTSLRNRADSLARVAREKADSLQATRSRINTLLIAQRRELDSLIAAIPQTPPSPAPELLRDTWETLPLPDEVRDAGVALLSYAADLETERNELRTVVNALPSRLAARDSIWVQLVLATERALVAERQARRGAEYAYAALEASSRTGWATVVICGAGGAALGSLHEPPLIGGAVGALAAIGLCALARR